MDDGIADHELEGKYLTFFLEKQLFGIPIADVVQIIELQKITPMPDYPHYVKGVINLRGNILPVIDTRLRLGRQEGEYHERTCIIVTQLQGNQTGMIVDYVDAVTDIDQANIEPPPQLAGERHGNGFLTGIAKHGDRVILLMDSSKVLSV